jgi:hypothetical protein
MPLGATNGCWNLKIITNGLLCELLIENMAGLLPKAKRTHHQSKGKFLFVEINPNNKK